MDSRAPSNSETSRTVVDDRFMQDWVAYGMLELAVYLDRHARFADYCDRRDADRL